MKIFPPALAALIVALSGFLGGTGALLQAAEAESPIYLVAFRLTHAATAKQEGFETLKVIDLLSGSNNAVAYKPPQTFIDDARKQVESEELKSAGGEVRAGSTLTSFVHVPAAESSRILLAALDGAMNVTSNLRLLGREASVSTFGKNLGNAAFFLMYYALPDLPKQTKEQREAIIEAEMLRNAANAKNAEILSKKNLSTDTQSIVEITAKSSQNKALTIRSRYLCNDRQMLGLVAITPDTLPAANAQAFDRMIEAFRFR